VCVCVTVDDCQETVELTDCILSFEFSSKATTNDFRSKHFFLMFKDIDKSCTFAYDKLNIHTHMLL